MERNQETPLKPRLSKRKHMCLHAIFKPEISNDPELNIELSEPKELDDSTLCFNTATYWDIIKKLARKKSSGEDIAYWKFSPKGVAQS